MNAPEAPIPLHQVDAFTSERYAGNPAAVCLLDRAREPAWMQAVAREMNLSETAFLVARGGADFDLRWFTPKVEVDLCGHATLASAHVLWETGRLARDRDARFHTASGVLGARRAEGSIVLDFPKKPVEPIDPPRGLLESLGVEATFVGKNRLDHLVVVESEATVRALRPDFATLAKVETRGTIVTSRGQGGPGGADFVSRYFAPRVGIDEDPVTGSAHCCLAPYWTSVLGRDALVGHQVSERGGVVRCRTIGDRVELGGQAVTVLRGELV